MSLEIYGSVLLNSTDDVNESLDYWYKLFQGVLDKHQPLKSKEVKNIKQPDWMTDEIIKCIKERDSHKADGNFAL